MNIAAQFKTNVFLLTQMGSISSSPLNTSFLLKKKTLKKLPENPEYAEMRHNNCVWHGDVIFYNKMTSQITCGRCAAVRFFYLSHGLAWLVLGRLIISLYEGGIEKSVP